MKAYNKKGEPKRFNYRLVVDKGAARAEARVLCMRELVDALDQSTLEEVDGRRVAYRKRVRRSRYHQGFEDKVQRLRKQGIWIP